MLIAKEKIEVKHGILPSFSRYVDNSPQNANNKFKGHVNKRKGKSSLGGNSIELEDLNVRAFSQTQSVNCDGNHDYKMNYGDKNKIIKEMNPEVESFPNQEIIDDDVDLEKKSP
jgi:hypothetical protein